MSSVTKGNVFGRTLTLGMIAFGLSCNGKSPDQTEIPFFPIEPVPKPPGAVIPPADIPQIGFSEPRAERHSPISDDAATAIAGRPGIATTHQDLVVECLPYAEGAAPTAPLECGVGRVDSSGQIETLVPTGIRSAFRMPGKRMLLWNTALDLLVVEPGGKEILIAKNTFGPRLSVDGERVVFNLLPEKLSSLDPRVKYPIVVADLRAGTLRVATEAVGAYAGLLVPGTDDVLYVGDKSGIASFWIASPGHPDRQLTNTSGRNKKIYPVFAQQSVWMPGTHQLVFTAHYDTNTLWALDVERAEMELLGPGRLPALDMNGGVVSALDGYPEPIAHYRQPGTP